MGGIFGSIFGSTVPGSSVTGYPTVNTFADLPLASSKPNKVYVVLTATGTWPFNKKNAGMYHSNGVLWEYMSVYPDILKDANFGIQNSTDGTKVVKFDVSKVRTGTTSSITVSPNAVDMEDINAAILALIEHAGTGLNNPSGADLIIQTGVNTISVLPETGYISNNVDERTRISWRRYDNVTPVGLGPNFVRIDKTGELNITLDANFDVDEYIELGYIFAAYFGGTFFISNVLNTPKYNSRFTSRVNDFWTLVLGALVKDGTGVSALGPTSFGISVAPGRVFANGVLKPIGGGVSTTSFTKYYNSTDGWSPSFDSPNLLSSELWNDVSRPNVSALQPMPTGKWKQDVIFRTLDGSVFALCGQAVYDTEAECDKAPIAAAPEQLANVAVFLAKINLQQGSTGIEGSSVYDIRPNLARIFGFGSASAGSVMSHNSLTDLTVGDPHTQYVLWSVANSTFAAIANGVTNGDAHNHSGGDGGQIAYSSLSNPPSIADLGGVPTTRTVNSKALSADVTISTADVADSTDKRYCTEAQKTVIGNTSGSNTGDESTATIKTKLGITTLSGANTGDESTATIKTKLGITTLSGSNTGDQTLSGLGGVPTTRTVNSKALSADVTLSTADVADSTDKRYCTDAQKTVIGNTSGSNTGDESTATIKTKLGITTLSGSNTGDQTLSGLGGVPTTRTVNSKALSADINLGASDIGLGNVSNEAQLKVASNLSDVADRQTALNTLMAASAAANESVATKDTSTGNIVFKAPTGGSLPAGTTGQTLRHNGSGWEASSALINDGNNISAEFYENVVAVSTSSIAHTIDWNNGGLQQLTLAHSPVTLTFTTPSRGAKSLRLVVIQDATGDRNIIYPATVSFEDSLPPMLNKAPGAITILDFVWTGSVYRFSRPVIMGKQSDTNFYSVATDPNNGLVAASISSGTTALLAAADGSPTTKRHCGVARLLSSTTTNSGYKFQTDVTSQRMSGGDVFICDFAILTNPSISTHRFGFHDTVTVSDAVDGVYFEVVGSTSPVLSGKSSNNSVRTATGTTYTLTPGAWYRASIIMSYDGTRVDFYLFNDAGALVWTNSITTNIPTASGRECGIGFISTNVGFLASTLAYVDFMKWGNQCNF